MKLDTQTMTNGFSIVIIVLMAATYLLYLRHGQPDGQASLGQSIESAHGVALPGPSPTLDPVAAFTRVTTALRQNDTPRADAGIETAYRFASPGNRLAIGSLDAFRDVVHTPAFAPLIDHRSADVALVRQRGDQALLVVRLIDAHDEPVMYEVLMSRQYMPPYKGCWMTDGVRRVVPSPPGTDPAPDAAPIPPDADPTPGSRI